MKTFDIKYVIMSGIPMPRIGSAVPVGIMIFHEDRLDIRMKNLKKLNARDDWSQWEKEISLMFNVEYQGQDANEFLELCPIIDSYWILSDLIKIETNDYEKEINNILLSI